MRQEKAGSSARKAKMSDTNKNSTQISNSKGETNIRPTPIGGYFASMEEKEPELGAILEKSFSAYGGFSFNPDLQLPPKVASTLFQPNKWVSIAGNTVVNAVETAGKVISTGLKEGVGALTGLAKDIFVSEKPKDPVKPEERKKMEDDLALRQAMKVIENALAQSSHQGTLNSKQEEIRQLGKSITLEEGNRKLKRNSSYSGSRNGFSNYELAEIRAVEAEEAKMIKKTEMQQTRMETSKGANLKNRTDAQEGQSTTANAIATAG